MKPLATIDRPRLPVTIRRAHPVVEHSKTCVSLVIVSMTCCRRGHGSPIDVARSLPRGRTAIALDAPGCTQWGVGILLTHRNTRPRWQLNLFPTTCF